MLNKLLVAGAMAIPTNPGTRNRANARACQNLRQRFGLSLGTGGRNVVARRLCLLAVALFIALTPQASAATTTVVPYGSAGFKYETRPIGQSRADWARPSLDEFDFSSGTAPFGTLTYCSGVPSPNTVWQPNSEILLRRSFELPAGATMVKVGLAHYQDFQVAFNGTIVGTGIRREGCPLQDSSVVSVPDAVVLAGGTNYLAVLGKSLDIDQAYLDVQVTMEAVADTTAPIVAITTPPDGASYTVGQTVLANFACQDEAGGSGLRSCTGTVANGEAIDTSTPGAKAFTVTATDNVGNATTVTHNYTVVEPPDTTPPTVTCSATPASLKANNSKLATITTTVTVTDNAGGSGAAGFTLVSVSSSEADSGVGNRDQPLDIQGWTIGTADTTGQLRQERFAASRVYTLTYQGRDNAGNTASCQATITVGK